MDYKKLGFKSGIEIHQQLDGRRLFSKTKVEIRKGNHDFEITRQLRASEGERGKKDKAAEFEMAKNKQFKYLGYNDLSSLVETDEEPPAFISEQAVIAVTQVATLLNCVLVDKVEFMRKVVVDGSNVSGFQRTAIIGLNGYVKVQGKKYGIETVCLEEEACQTVSRSKKEDVYNLSRLGIPLIEIATAPDMNTPEEVKLIAEHIGMILRSTKGIRRGIGSIRQDVNVSITGRNRVEIKGFQDVKSIKKIVEYEVNRQKKLKSKELGHVRKAEPSMTTSYLRPMPGSARMYPETDVRSFVLPNKVVVPKLISNTIRSLTKKYKVSEHLVKDLVKQGIDLDKYAKKFPKVKPQLIAEFFAVTPKEIRRKHKVEFKPLDNLDIFTKLSEGNLTASALPEVTLSIAKGKKVDYTKYKAVDNKAVEKVIDKIIKANKNAPIGMLMGKAMAELKGKADGKTVMQILKKKVK